MTAQSLSKNRDVISAIPAIEHMDIFSASMTHLLLRVRFTERINFPRLLEGLQFRLKRGRKTRNCEVEKIKYNKLGHWEFHLMPKKGKFPFGKKSIFRRRDEFTDQTVEIHIYFAEEWHTFFAHLY